jgi:hypothetical protein
MGHCVHQLLATLCEASSLALLPLGGSNTSRWVLPSITKLWQIPPQSWDLLQVRLPYPMMYMAHRMRSQMTRKIIFTAPFYHSYIAQPLCLLVFSTVGLQS